MVTNKCRFYYKTKSYEILPIHPTRLVTGKTNTYGYYVFNSVHLIMWLQSNLLFWCMVGVV